ncbi:hypothetical protein N748_11735 [Legionella pneumophila str. 121004]|nr:hypothetical protein N748_11735 [Legionella pneumophila str. 121004]ERH42001.1 hypothetical protein N750_02670 [Legionella pneumophila str. Leg01/53]ERH45864.1 hypothetical protein N751_09920 [Legionella pneumophila str. Leg01/11]ERI49070.1 hypothetical protein N749_06775 [Legionella pneumophila str. Leg01/20]
MAGTHELSTIRGLNPINDKGLDSNAPKFS